METKTIPEGAEYAVITTSNILKEATFSFYTESDVLCGSWTVPYESSCAGMDRFNALVQRIAETVDVYL